LQGGKTKNCLVECFSPLYYACKCDAHPCEHKEGTRGVDKRDLLGAVQQEERVRQVAPCIRNRSRGPLFLWQQARLNRTRNGVRPAGGVESSTTTPPTCRQTRRGGGFPSERANKVRFNATGPSRPPLLPLIIVVLEALLACPCHLPFNRALPRRVVHLLPISGDARGAGGTGVYVRGGFPGDGEAPGRERLGRRRIFLASRGTANGRPRRLGRRRRWSWRAALTGEHFKIWEGGRSCELYSGGRVFCCHCAFTRARSSPNALGWPPLRVK